jgi:hypothetical protein
MLAVPRMDEFVRQQRGPGVLLHAVVLQHVLGGAVVARPVVLQAEVGDAIAQRQEKRVRRIMAGAEQSARLGNKAVEVRLHGRAHADRLSVVAGQGDGVTRPFVVLGADRDLLEVSATQYRRIEESFQRGGLESQPAVGGSLGVQGGGVLPIRRQAQTGIHLDVSRRRAFRIEQRVIPIEHRQVGRDRGAGAESSARRR